LHNSRSRTRRSGCKKTPRPDSGVVGSTSVRMILSVEDPDAAYDRAVVAGATEVARVSEENGWRTGRVTDPFGYDWELNRQLTE
jgi:PhnB protein